MWRVDSELTCCWTMTLGNSVIMSNVATLAGHVTVEDHAVIGGLAAVHQFCRIGKMAIVGGCSKVVQDVPPFMLADGNPAETRTINKVGLERNGIGAEVQTSLRQAYKILFREGLTITNALERISSISIMSESPGRTGCRHFTLSADMK